MVQDHATMVPETEGSLAPVLESCEIRSGEPLPSCIHFDLVQTFFFFLFSLLWCYVFALCLSLHLLAIQTARCSSVFLLSQPRASTCARKC